MAGVVCSELRFEAFWGDSVVFDTHDTGIVDEDINFVDGAVDGVGGFSYRIKSGEIHLDEFH